MLVSYYATVFSSHLLKCSNAIAICSSIIFYCMSCTLSYAPWESGDCFCSSYGIRSSFDSFCGWLSFWIVDLLLAITFSGAFSLMESNFIIALNISLFCCYSKLSFDFLASNVLGITSDKFFLKEPSISSMTDCVFLIYLSTVSRRVIWFYSISCLVNASSRP